MRTLLVGVVAGVVVVAGVALALSVHTVPAQRSFQFSSLRVADAAIGCASDITPSAGTEVSIHWWAANSTEFGVWSCGRGGQAGSPLVYLGNGTHGAEAFEAHGGGYSLGVLCTVFCQPLATVAGNYTGSVLVL